MLSSRGSTLTERSKRPSHAAGGSLVTATILGPEAMAILSNDDYLAVGEDSNGTGGTEVELSLR